MKSVTSKTFFILALAQSGAIYSKGAGGFSVAAREAEIERERLATRVTMVAKMIAPAYHIRYSSLQQLDLIKKAHESLNQVAMSEPEKIQIKKIIIDAQQNLLNNSEKFKSLVYEIRNSPEDGDIIRGFSIEHDADALYAEKLVSNLKETLKGTEIGVSDEKLLDEANSLVLLIQYIED